MKFKILAFIIIAVFQPDIFCNSFDTLYHQGLAAQHQANWDIALDYYLQAYAINPTRVEPLVKIAQHYIEQGELEVAFMFARRACEQPIPDDVLFNALERELYTVARYQALSACALSVREWKLGLWATKQALASCPGNEHLHERLCFYHEQLVLEAGRAIEISEFHE